VTGYAGFFGKLPSTGDFVARGLPEGFVRPWDRWITRHVAPLGLPADGLRFSLVSGGRCVAGVLLPSQDRLGRQFPLSLVSILPARPDPDEVDRWADAVLALAAGDADALAVALEELAPMEAESAASGPLLVWRKGGSAREAPVSAPDAALAAALSSR
jgi:type VI secretion system protein ImpM